ncbi:hypothetical protein QU38_01050, partial [Staphylococcus aureus]
AAGADDQRRTFDSSMCAEIGDRRVGHEFHPGEGEGERGELLSHSGARDARNAHAGADRRHLGFVQPGGRDRLAGDVVQHYVEPLDPDPGIGRAALAGAEDRSALVCQPAAAMAAARIYAEEIDHGRSLQQPGPALPCRT